MLLVWSICCSTDYLNFWDFVKIVVFSVSVNLEIVEFVGGRRIYDYYVEIVGGVFQGAGRN